MTGALRSERVPPGGNDPRTAWAAGLEVSIPEESDSVTAIDAVRLRAAFTPLPPASSRLPFSYQSVPLPMRTFVGHVLGRVQRRRSESWAKFPRWPIDLSADYVADLYGAPPSPFASGPVPVLLSHDIDTPEGLRNLVPRFLPIEESMGARSANYVVPCGWPLDHALLEETAQRGHEIGIHGYDHSNKTPFASDAERKQRIEAARPLIERYRVAGYRAPSLVRTQALLKDLAGLYRYDSSIPTSGGLFPVPNNGCASARPFRIGSLIEIPLTLPRDGSLRFLGHTAEEILEIWRSCAERIAASGGVVSLLTHCEDRFSGNAEMLSVYRRFVEFLAADGRFFFATTAQVMERFEASR